MKKIVFSSIVLIGSFLVTVVTVQADNHEDKSTAIRVLREARDKVVDTAKSLPRSVKIGAGGLMGMISGITGAFVLRNAEDTYKVLAFVVKNDDKISKLSQAVPCGVRMLVFLAATGLTSWASYRMHKHIFSEDLKEQCKNNAYTKGCVAYTKGCVSL